MLKRDEFKMANSTCKGCGAEITWAHTDTGAKIPLDKRAPVYAYYLNGDGKRRAKKVDNDGDSCFHVSHFSTCPKANDFSGSKKKQLDEWEDA